MKTELLFLMVLVYFVLLTNLLPPGINKTFIFNTIPYLLGLIAFLFIALGIFILVSKAKTFEYTNEIRGFKARHLLLGFLPMTPIMQYAILNQDTLTLKISFYFIAYFLAVIFVVAYVAPLILGTVLNRHLAMLTGISLCYFFFSMPSWALEFNWYKSGDFKLQIGILLGIFTLISIMFYMQEKMLYVVLISLFVVNSGNFYFKVKLEKGNEAKVSVKADEKSPPETFLFDFIGNEGVELKHTPDVYLLTYDAYVSQATMSQLGIDNQVQEYVLKKNGFKQYEGIYSIGQHTLGSMTRVLDLEYDRNNRDAVAGHGTIQKVFTEIGYETYGVFKGDFFFRGTSPGYDIYYPKLTDFSGMEALIRAVEEGQFRFDIEFEKYEVKKFINAKRAMFKHDSEKPKFMYTHTGPSHSQNSGRCRDNETDLFEKRLKKANIEMLDDVKKILNRDREAIIIINGDHGPYLTGDCTSMKYTPQDQIGRLEMQDRHGAFLAIRWPDSSFEEYDDDIQTIQDIFPVVLSYLYEDKTPLAMSLPAISEKVKGVYIDNGVIVNGKNDGERLYVE